MSKEIIQGIVRAAGPVAGVAVSNGEIIVESTGDGSFEVPLVEGKHQTVFMTVPDGYEAANGFYRLASDILAWKYAEFHLRKRRKVARGVFLHIADTHLNALSDERVLPELLTAQLREMTSGEPAAGMIAATGDLTNRGDSRSLQEWTIITRQVHPPTAPGFGGHDGLTERGFPARKGSIGWPCNFTREVAPPYYSFEWSGYHFTCYDCERSFFDAQRHAMRDRWLPRDLARAEGRMPVVILMHTPPIASFVRRMARAGVIAIFHGHWHSSKAHVVAGVKVFSTPSLPWGNIDTRPRCYRRVRLSREGVNTRTETLPRLPDVMAAPSGGQVLWQRRIPGGMHRAGIVACGERLLISLCDEDLSDRPGVLALDSANGRTLWRAETDASVKNSVAVAGGLCFAVSVTGELTAIDVESGRCRWRRRLRGHPDRWIFTSPLVWEGLVVAGTAFGLEAHEQRTGRLAWEWKHPTVSTDGWSHYAGPLLASGHLVVPCMRRGLTALRPSDGEPQWCVDGYVEYPLAQPAAGRGRVFAGFCPRARRLMSVIVAIDAESGGILRQEELGKDYLSALAVEGDSLCSVTTDGFVRLHNAGDGSLQWSAELEVDKLDVTPYRRGTRSAWARPLMADGKVILACADGRLRVYDVGSGRLLRAVAFPDALTATPCLLDGTLYAGTYSGALWALHGDALNL